MSPDSLTAATASADFTANIWDVHTGELLYVLQHNHIVRAVAYAPDNSDLVATGGMEKKLRIFDLTEMKPKEEPAAATNDTAEAAGLSQQPNGVSSTAAPLTNGGSAASVLSSSVSSVSSAAGGAPVAQPQQPETTGPITIPASSAFEIGAGVHTASIRFIVWTRDANVLVTASDRTLRWFDLPSRSVMKQEELDGEIRSCELVSLAPEHSDPNNDIGGGLPVLAVAAGREVYFWGGLQASDELKRMRLPYGVASVGLDLRGRKFVVGEEPGTWARVLRWDDGSELGKPFRVGGLCPESQSLNPGLRFTRHGLHVTFPSEAKAGIYVTVAPR